MSMQRLVKSILVLSPFLALGAAAHAQTNAMATGDWNDLSTWTAGIPTGTSAAFIDGGFNVTVTQPDATTNLLDVGTASGQSGMLTVAEGGILTISDVDPGTEPNLPSIRIAQAAGSTGTFNVNGGTINIGGDSPSGLAIGELIVGDNGNATMTMTGGVVNASDEVFIGLQASSTSEATITGGELRANGRSVLVGFSGNGTLIVDGETAKVYAGVDLIAGFFQNSVSTVDLKNGTIEVGALLSNWVADGTGSTVTLNQSGGTFTARVAYIMGLGPGTTTLNHTGGLIEIPTNNGDFVVSDQAGNTSIYNISGTAEVDALHNILVGTFAGSNGTINQSGGTIDAGDNALIGIRSTGVWNISGGSANVRSVFLGDLENSNGTINQTGGSITAREIVRVGGDAIGTWNLSGGTATMVHGFLGDFDSSFGTLRVSGGTLDVTGNLSIGGALASNAAPDRVEPDGTNGAQGQALNANGTLIVRGNAGDINIGGHLLANPADKSPFRRSPTEPNGDNSATLVFEILNSSGTSLINTTGVADLDGAVIDIDLEGFTPPVNMTFDLIKASLFGNTGGTGTTENVGTGRGYTLAAEDSGIFNLAIVPTTGGELLQATFLGTLGVQGDFNGNGVVDAADYVLWRKGGPLQNDPTPGVSPEDYNFWRSRFGATSGGGSGLGENAVPEPTAFGLAILSASLVLSFCRRNRG